MILSRATSVINYYRLQGIRTFYSIKFISDYNHAPYLTDSVTFLNLRDGKQLKDWSSALGIREIKSHCSVKDSCGNSTHCSKYEILNRNNSIENIEEDDPSKDCENFLK